MSIVMRALLAACALVILTPATAPAATLPDGMQKITVTASSYSTSWARLSAWQTSGGTYSLGFMFGAQTRPAGVTWPVWRYAHWYDKWDDDPASPRYNLWTDIRSQSAGRNPENMRTIPQYNYGIVIGYNTARTPGLGSAIFLHVGSGGATAGCVSLPTAKLLAVLRWLQSPASPHIVIKA